MEFLDIAKRRISVRSYEKKQVEEEKLDQIIMAAHVAPSAANLQPVKLVVVKSEDGLNKLAKSANVFGAPMAIVICSDHNRAWTRQDGKQTVDVDASIVTDHMMMEATSLGLGTLWVGKFDVAMIQKDFNLPGNLEPISVLGVGYAKEPLTEDRVFDKVRKPMDELVVTY